MVAGVLIVAVLALAAVGSAIGGAAMTGTFLGMSGAAWGWTVGSLVGNLLFPQQGPDQHTEGPRFSDLKIQTSAYGAMVPILAGTKRVAGNVIWARPIREVATTTSQEVGKGGGGQTVSQTTYRYFADFAVLLCEGEALGLRRAWIAEMLKYNVADDATSGTIAASAFMANQVRFYPGSESQDVDPLIYADKDVDTPAYRGSCYVVIEGMDVTDYGGRIPPMEFEVVMAGTVASELDITAGTTVSSTSVVSTGGKFLLGRGGNIWTLGVASNTAVRLNFYANAVASTYVRASWGYNPVGLTPDGEGFYSNAGGFAGILREDGTVEEWSGGFGSMGSGASLFGVSWIDQYNGYAQGDSSSSNNLIRFLLSHSEGSGNTISATILTGARSTHLFTNACGIGGRCYVYGSSTFSHDVGYIDTGTDSKVLLFTGTAYAVHGLVVSRDGYLWMARSGASTDVEKRDAGGSLIGSVAIPSGTVSRLFEAPNGYIIAFVGSGKIYGIHPTLLTIDFTSENVGSKVPIGFTEDGRLVLWSTTAGSIDLHEMEPLARVAAGTTPLDDYIVALCGRVGLSLSDIDVTQLAGENIAGYGIARRAPLRASLELLRPVYRFDTVESDRKIKFVKRGGAVAADIPLDDLAAHRYGEEMPAPIGLVRRIETDLPREVAATYENIDANFRMGAQYARRLTGRSAEVKNVDLAMVLDDDQAAGVAEWLLYDAWASRNGVEFTLSRKYAALEPTDVVTLADAYTVRITDVSDDAGLLRVKGVTEELNLAALTAIGAASPSAPAEVGLAGPTAVALLDIPLLRDEDDGDAGFYAAAAGYTSAWRGAELWVSRDNGSSYARTSTAFLAANVMGSALTVLATFAGGNVFDESSTVDVQVFGGELVSATADAVLAGANAAYLGGELIQFKNATLLSTGRYRLSGLLRARKGTEQYLASHAVGDQFVLLDSSTLKRIPLATSDIGMPLIFKAPSFGQTVEEATPIPFTPAAIGLEPLAPVLLGIGRSAAASYDISIKWVRRARKVAEWRDYVDVPVDDAPEAYEVEIYTSSAYTTLKRTITGLSSPAATYTSAQQVTDFGANQATIYVKVYQVSAIAGRGFPLTGQG